MNRENDSLQEEENFDEMSGQRQRGAAAFPVAGIGASAGGLEAIRSLLENLPANTGISYVIVQHLSADHESILPELLERKTDKPVHLVQNGIPLQADHIYVIPPNTYMNIVDGHLTLLPRRSQQGLFMPIDFFFKNLGNIYQNKAIGILLSGTGSDGTAGFKEIKAEGGITFAQDNSATFSGMPKNAVDSGFVDFILSPREIAHELNDILRLPYTSLAPAELHTTNDTELRRILVILNDRKGVDFSLYKQTTINRRILRRMALSRKKTLEEYTQVLRENNKEVELLFQDLLINVTSFFRDEVAFKALNKEILPALIKDRKTTDPIRIWVAACASGEEACSFAITIFEFLAEEELQIPFQIFATDLNPLAIQKARMGIYSSGSLENVSPKRLEKFFTKIDGHYQVIKSIRDVCVFATHNLLTDPPFSRMDIVSCQNVMIYFETIAQKKILKAFHYALKPNGFLVLGKSETISGSAELFAQNQKDKKIYIKKDAGNNVDFDFSFPASRILRKSPSLLQPEVNEKANELDIEKLANKFLLSHYVPPGVVINSDFQILRFHGSISRYLQPAFGKASLHLLKMVRDDLIFEIRSLVTKAKKEVIVVEKQNIHLLTDKGSELLTLAVVPLRTSSPDPYFLVLFKESGIQISENIPVISPEERRQAEDQQRLRLEYELSEMREQMKTMNEEFEASKEELQSANEEVISANEELQSMNEELETSKEELQSTNEELTTINEELHHRNIDLKEAFDYREAIVETIREPLIVLKPDLRVKTANRAFYRNFHQKQNETEGYFIDEMNNGQWKIPGLKEKLIGTISKEKSFENFEVAHEFTDIGKRIILFSAMQMRFDENKKDRILLVIEDITMRREAEDRLKRALHVNTSILSSISDIFISVDNNWNIIFANEKAESFIGKKMSEISGKDFWKILISYMDTDFHTILITAMKEKSFTQFEYYDKNAQEWYHFRLYPSQETFSIYGNRITEEKTSQRLLQESKERYQDFISKTNEGVCRFDLKKPVSIKQSKEDQINELYEGAFVAECNDSMAKMYHFEKADQLAHVAMKDLLTQNDQKKELIAAFVESKYNLTEVETTFVSGEKEFHFVNNLIGIIENDAITSIWGIQRDITSKKLIENTLIKTRNALQFTLAAGSVGTFTWNFKTNVISWTNVQESLYGLKKDSFKGTLENWMSFIHPEDVPETRKAIEESIEKQTELSVEFRIIWPDGSLHWMLNRADTIYDSKGIPVEMSGINIDISERKFKEQIIRENEERFRALVQNSFDIITVFNIDGTITYQSESIERVLGYSAKERLGQNIFQQTYVHSEDRQIEKNLFNNCMHHPSRYILGELRMMNKDGRYRVMEVGYINLLNNTSIHGIITNYRDITQRKEIEKQKEEFITIASHELKTPVTSIKAYAQILYDSLIEKKDNVSADLLLRMDHQIDRLTSLISDLLDVTKISEGQLTLRREEYDLEQVITEVVTDLQMTTKRHKIITEIGKDIRLAGDRERTGQVIVNLLSNAIKYSPSADKIIIRASATEEEVIISVQDFGIGILPEMQKKLFKRFFRITDETTKTFPGLGLGLFISTEIVKKQKGRIWVESTPGEGSTFRFALPYSW